MLLDQANQIPPFVCRIIARKHSGFIPLSHSDIAQASGLSRSTVAAISRKVSWHGVTVDKADRFARACGVDLSQPRRALRWLRRAGLIHLQRGTSQQRRFIKSLLTAQRIGT